MGADPVEEPEPEPEPEPVEQPEPTPDPQVAAPTAPAQGGAPQPPAAAPSPVLVQAHPAPPQLFPLQLPDGRVTYVTADQLGYLAQQGAASLVQPRQQPQQPAAVPQPAPAEPAFDTARAQDIARRLNYGSPEEQASAILDLQRSFAPAQPQQQIQPQQIVQQAVAEAIRATETQNNLRTVAFEYPEIFGSRVLAQVAAVQLHELRQQNPQVAYLPELEQYRMACNAVRAGLAPVQQQPAASPSPAPQAAAQPAASQARIERKRAAPQPPAATDRRLEVQGQPRVPTGSEIVDQMRRARGQPSLLQ